MQVDHNFLLNKIKYCGDILKKSYFADEDIKFRIKNDGSKISIFDKDISNFFQKELFKKYPSIPFFSEEDSENLDNILNEKNFFLMDPIDGTDSFVKKKDEFTVNLTYVSNDKLIFSCIFSPIKNILLYSDEKDSFKVCGSKKIKIKNKKKNLLDSYKVITTRRQEEITEITNILEKYNIQYELSFASSALKFCILANGEADIYIRKANIKLWDVISGFHILNNADFFIKDGNGNSILEYILDREYLKSIHKKEFRICEFIIQNTEKLNIKF